MKPRLSRPVKHMGAVDWAKTQLVACVLSVVRWQVRLTCRKNISTGYRDDYGYPGHLTGSIEHAALFEEPFLPVSNHNRYENLAENASSTAVACKSNQQVAGFPAWAHCK